MIEPTNVAKQMITFQKTLFENSFNAMVNIQDQTEKMTDTFLSKLTWLPEDGKKTFNDTMCFYKKSRDDFKKAVDDGFIKLENMSETLN